MRVDGEANIIGVTTHLYGKGRFGDEIARIWTHNSGADHPAVVRVKQQFSDAFVATKGKRAAIRRPGESPFLVSDVVRLCFAFCYPDPRDFWIGIRNRRNDVRIECYFMAGDNFGSDFAFMDRLVRKHRLSDNIADSGS